MQENLLYVIGIPKTLANEELLVSDRFFGQYGQVKKIVINKMTSMRESAYEGQCAVYIWYQHPV